MAKAHQRVNKEMLIWNMERQKATIKMFPLTRDQELYMGPLTAESMGKRRKKDQISGDWGKLLIPYGKFLKLVRSDIM